MAFFLNLKLKLGISKAKPLRNASFKKKMVLKILFVSRHSFCGVFPLTILKTFVSSPIKSFTQISFYDPDANNEENSYITDKN